MRPEKYCFACMEELPHEGCVCPQCGYDNSVRVNGLGVLPPMVLADQYIVGKTLGRGGFGITYIGRDYLERIVAIKEYFPGEMVNREEQTNRVSAYDECENDFEEGKRRAQREGKTLIDLVGIPGIVKVYTALPHNNTVYIIMEYVKGITLGKLVKQRGGRLGWEEAFNLIKPIMVTLQAIHEAGFIHRDVSPDNIMIRASNGEPVLLDFGAAYQYERKGSHSVTLKDGYSPTEQYLPNAKLDGRTDEYALCATIYYAITGQKPPVSNAVLLGEEEIVPPSQLGADISLEIESVLLRGLAVQKVDRYESIKALREAFTEAMSESKTIGIKREKTVQKVNEPSYEKEKPNQKEQVRFMTEDIRKYFPKNYSNKDMQQTIIKLLENWQRKRERNAREER